MAQAIQDIKDLEQATNLYYQLKEEADKATKELKLFNDQIKKFMATQDTNTVQFENGLNVIIGTQNRSQVDKELLVQILKEYHLEDAIKTVEIPDEQAVERMIYLGILPTEAYMKAVKENYIQTLKVIRK